MLSTPLTSNSLSRFAPVYLFLRTATCLGVAFLSALVSALVSFWSWLLIAFSTSSLEAMDVSIPNPAMPNALPTADVWQFSMYDVLLMKLASSFSYACPTPNTTPSATTSALKMQTPFSLEIISDWIVPIGNSFLNALILSLTSTYGLSLIGDVLHSSLTLFRSSYVICIPPYKSTTLFPVCFLSTYCDNICMVEMQHITCLLDALPLSDFLKIFCVLNDLCCL